MSTMNGSERAWMSAHVKAMVESSGMAAMITPARPREQDVARDVTGSCACRYESRARTAAWAAATRATGTRNGEQET
jgi:hypothetical protein